MSTLTRDRIVDEAMRLFGDLGYKATTIARIEAAAGLTPGAGGVYHHFASKEAVLEAGVARQLQRMESIGAMRRLFTSLGDLRAELTLIARYVLAELDQETQLLRLLAADARGGPDGLSRAARELTHASFAGFADWIREQAPDRTEADALALATTGLGALMSSRLLRDVLGVPPALDDAVIVDAWVEMMARALSA